MTRTANAALEVTAFLQAIAHQLDLAQDALRLKARTGRPLTWALKDLDIDLQVFVEIDRQGTMRWRTAGPNETGASTVKLSFTTITREMVEENTFAFELDEDPRSLDHLDGDLTPEARHRLQLAGIRTVGQYRRVAEEQPEAVQLHTGIPALDLQAALRRSSRPVVTGHEVVDGPDGEPLVRIRGANLKNGVDPDVRLSGEPVQVLRAAKNEVLVRPLSHHVDGQVEVKVGSERATGWFRVPARAARADGWTDALGEGGT